MVRRSVTPHVDQLYKSGHSTTVGRHGDRRGRSITKAPHKPHTRERTGSIPTGDDRTCAFRASLELPGAKDWLKAPPSPALQKHVPNHLFRMWLKFYTRTPIINRTAQTCPRPKFSTVLDHFGDHLLICQFSSSVGDANRTSRHNRQVRLFAEDLGRAARTLVIEPKQYLGEQSRPDIRALSRGGGDDIIDIAIFHTFSSPSAGERTL